MPTRFKDTVSIEDAKRISGPTAFNIMLKPAGSLCNLDCRYCYYLDKSEIYGGVEPRMSVEMLETIIREYIRANEVPEVQFDWHGGEPMVLGLDFYKKAVELQRKYADGKVIHNTLQTNGTLMDRRWADFFRDNGFLIGISIDGPEDIHDRYRKDKGGFPTFRKVMDAIALMRSAGVEFNTMSTVNKMSEGRGLETYQFLKSIGSRYMQFMAVVEHVKYPVDEKGKEKRNGRPYIVDPDTEGARLATWSVSDIAFGKFLCDIFDWWVCNDVGICFVNQFDAALASWCGVRPATCVYNRTCGEDAVIEHNGDVYPCDHFVYSKYLLGNISEKPLNEIMSREKRIRFGINKRNSLPSKCFRCKYIFACNGECPKHRFNRTETGETGLNALCGGYYKFFDHVAPYMEKMRELLVRELPPAAIMPWARTRISSGKI